jgi:glycosyltransferase involved in cell wall biosynthesis
MRILIVHNSYKERGGEETIVENETKLLQSSGIAVYNLFYTNKTKVYQSVFNFIQMPFNVVSYFLMLKKIKECKPDIVHIHNWHFSASPSIIRAAKMKKIPVVLSIHNFRLFCPSGILFHNRSLFLNSLKERFPFQAVREKVYRNSFIQTFWLAFSVKLHKKTGTWKSVDCYIVNTKMTRELFLNSNMQLKERQVALKPNFIFDKANGCILRKEHFLFVGRLTVEKGIYVLLEAFSKIPFQLIIIGDGPLREEVKKYAHLHDNIIYCGPLEHNAIAQKMSEASALIFPSVWYEGMPMAIIEAFCTGTPVIASKLGAMEAMIENGGNGLHFEVGNAANLKEKILYWHLLSKEEKQKYSVNARACYEKLYTPDKNLKQLLSIYQSILDANKIPFHFNALAST